MRLIEPQCFISTLNCANEHSNNLFACILPLCWPPKPIGNCFTMQASFFSTSLLCLLDLINRTISRWNFVFFVLYLKTMFAQRIGLPSFQIAVQTLTLNLFDTKTSNQTRKTPTTLPWRCYSMDLVLIVVRTYVRTYVSTREPYI